MGLFLVGLLALAGLVLWSTLPETPLQFISRFRQTNFNGQRAFQDLKYQVALGPRTPGSAAHRQVVDWLVQTLDAHGWEVEVQEGERLGHPVRNVIARRAPARVGTSQPWLVLGAHYDSRLVADLDPDPQKRTQPVPGANDGASGVAVLVELGRVLPRDLELELWLAFFDVEDNGNLPGWDWILGSRLFVERLPDHPDAAVIVDMVGDEDLNLHYERNSDPRLSRAIWAQAEALGYGDVFIPTPKYAILDDHTPFLQAGIPAVDIIDFDYPPFHTTNDDLEHVAAESLDAVGDTLQAWLLSVSESGLFSE